MLKSLFYMLINNRWKKETNKQGQENDIKVAKIKIPTSYIQLKEKLEMYFDKCDDLIIREIEVGCLRTKAFVVYFEGFVDKQVLSQNVINPIMHNSGENDKTTILRYLQMQVISSSQLTEMDNYEEAVSSILSGDASLFIEGEDKALRIGVKSPDKRPVEEPDMEISMKGSREGFTESLRTNTILLRKRIKNYQFKVEAFVIGEKSKTEIAICYIDGIVSPEILKELKIRIKNIKIDAIIASGYIEQFIQDGKYPLFPMVGNSEKPDKVVAKVLEGRVAILVDGTPTVLTVPFLFIEALQSQEDYYGEYYFASFMRILRFVSLLLSIYLPALYVAVTSFHQTVIPFKLMLTMAASREGIPFSSFVESSLMLFTFEILREAGIRMPRAIGQAVSIVGAIVLGDAAVKAGIASAPLVIVVSLAGISSFIIPPLMKTGAILRIIFLIAANILGLMGIGIVTIILLSYLCNKRSFDLPYLTPFSPLHTADLKDSLIVVPIWAMFTRPQGLTKGRDAIKSTGKALSKGGEKLE